MTSHIYDSIHADRDDDFKSRVHVFYKLAAWRRVRDEVFHERGARCEICGQFIRGRYVVHHLVPLSPETIDDEAIAYGKDNLQLLCLECHNTLTLSKAQGFARVEDRGDVNLF
jgi:5-methylcytosine-specific restriction endonuclease McrA